jgi:hypothetical protein
LEEAAAASAGGFFVYVHLFILALSHWNRHAVVQHERTKRPNGLCDLLDEQSVTLLPVAPLAPFFTDAAMDTCLHWLKAEQSGKSFHPDASNTGRDPMNGKPLQVDTVHRTIRSVGNDLKLEENAPPSTRSGFYTLGPHDPTLWVPKWRERP